jgi:hypothetical protein
MATYPPPLSPNNRHTSFPDSLAAEDHDVDNDALSTVIAELGVNPSGTYGTVADRLSAVVSGGGFTIMSPFVVPAPIGKYVTQYAQGTNNALGQNSGTVNVAPLILPFTMTFSATRINCGTAGAGTGPTATPVIYADNGSIFPGALMYTFATHTAAASGSTENAVTPFTLQGGLYWAGSLILGSATTAPLMRQVSQVPAGSSDTDGSQNSYGCFAVQGNTAPPTTWPAVGGTSLMVSTATKLLLLRSA